MAHAAPAWHERVRDGVSLWAADYGGTGSAVLLLHGLAGYGEEWRDTAERLRVTHRVVAPDQRGHGRSDRHPIDMSRAAFVADAEMWISGLDLAPSIIVGQSLGGDTAMLLAAELPDSARALVVVEASPDADPDGPARVQQWLDSWPESFASREEALTFFGGDAPWARAWVGGLREHGERLLPAFDKAVMVEALRESSHDLWAAWDRVRCPILVVTGQDRLPDTVRTRMKAAQPDARFEEIRDAGHDVHIERAPQWLEVLTTFIAAIERSSSLTEGPGPRC
jgi:pimeloyl-ACP methyl ester carboxylesterase